MGLSQRQYAAHRGVSHTAVAKALATGRISAAQLLAVALLLPALVVGSILSHVVHHRVNGRFLRNFVQVFAIVSGIALIVHAS